jgi:hypothetical protein
MSVAVSAMNGSKARMRFATNCGCSSFLWTECVGSSAMASTWVTPPSCPISKGFTVPPGWYIIVAVRFDEKSSQRVTASLTASQLLTA